MSPRACLIAASLLLAGCSSQRCDTHKVLIGMTREEVVAICGEPFRESDSGGSYFKFEGRDYVEPKTHWMFWGTFFHRHPGDDVTLINGHVNYASSDAP